MRIAQGLIAAATILISPHAAAESVVVTSPCQPEVSPVTAADMAGYLAGTWQMSAAGTGFTQGTNMSTLTLSRDDATGALIMAGDGQSTVLTPMGLARDLGTQAAPDPEFDMAIEGLSGGGLSLLDIAVLTGCDRPMRYWWSMGSGTRKSWGGLMFVEPNMASGFIANSAGGSRHVILTRQ